MAGVACHNPAMARKQRSELKSTGYEIFIGILSILSIVNLFLLYALRTRPSTRCSR